MKRLSILATALIFATSAAPALAADKMEESQATSQQSSGHAVPADGHPEKDRKICRMETATGSVMPKRVCHTAAELAALQAQAAATKENLRH